jgi:hypothetical protein
MAHKYMNVVSVKKNGFNNLKTNKVMKQTAVEWLVEGINKLTGLSIANDEPMVEQAKEMEKQQIIDAHGVKVKHSIEQGTTVYTQTFGEQYYNETFKNK